MLYSMTGYGKSTGEYEGRSYTFELRTLNGKTTDIRLKLPNHFRSKEIELRQYLLDKIKRGKIECTVQVISSDADLGYGINISLLNSYYEQLSQFAAKHQLPPQDYLNTIIRIPNVVEAKEEDITDEEWSFILQTVDQAVEQLDAFRSKEGQALMDDLEGRVNSIKDLQQEIIPHEEKRKEALVERLNNSIKDNIKSDTADKNRLEQEIIYYLEKLDIHEEKVRLRQHCDYFLEELKSPEYEIGKKLNFISQEMGREINTLGAKAQYSPIQQIVVQMKVELDQIKEQLANVL